MKNTLDTKFGLIQISYLQNASRISLRIKPDGTLKITAPKQTFKFTIKQFIKNSEPDIQRLINNYNQHNDYYDGMIIGKNRLLKIRQQSDVVLPKIELKPNFLVVNLPVNLTLNSPAVRTKLRPQIKKSLTLDARQILPARLKYLADKNNFQYNKVRLTHQATKWGSCSSNKTISLNIALVKLEMPLIDYVLIHELCHLRQMNHSLAFWNEVKAIMPDYQVHRQKLKKLSPYI